MTVKRFICIFVCGVVLLSLVGCNSLIDMDNHFLSNETDPTQQNGDEHIPSVKRCEFASLAEMKMFFEVSDDSNESSSVSSTDPGIYQLYSREDAANIANLVGGLVFPVAEAEIGVRFVPETYYLDITYVIDDVQYRFFYSLDSSVDCEFTDTPVVCDVQLGPYMVDFARRDHARAEDQFYCEFDMNGICVEVWVTGDGIDVPSFVAFEFLPLASIQLS